MGAWQVPHTIRPLSGSLPWPPNRDAPLHLGHEATFKAQPECSRPAGLQKTRRARKERALYDTIIVGARCAGSALGLLLARRGYRVLLVDHATFPSDMPMSSHFVHQRGIACLARWGLREQVVATHSPP